MNRSKYPNELKKEGWKAMKKSLDREMPVKSNKIKQIVVLLLMLCIVAIVFQLINHNNNDNKSNNQINNKTINENVKISNTGAVAFNQINKNKRNDTILLKSPYNKSSISTSKLYQQSNNYEISKHTETNNIKTFLSENNTLPKEVINIPTETAISQIEARDEIRSVTKIAKKDLVLNTSDNHQLPLKDINLKIFNKKRDLAKYAFNPFIQINFYNIKPQFAGLEPEFIIGNQFIAGKHLFLGVKLIYCDYDIFNSGINIISDAYSQNENAYEFYSSPTITFKKLTINKGIFELAFYEGYNFNRKLNFIVETGLSTAGIVTKDMVKSNNKNPVSSEYLLLKTDNNISVVSIDELVQDYELYGRINLSYKLAKHFDLIAGYKHYFKSYNLTTSNTNNFLVKTDNVRRNFTSNISLGLKYNL